MIVKIIKSMDPKLWYANMIGEVLEVKDDRDGRVYSCAKTGHGIYAEDAKVVPARCECCKQKETCPR